MEAAGVNYSVCGVVGLAEVGCDTNCLLPGDSDNVYGVYGRCEHFPLLMPVIRARLKTVNYCGNLGFSIGFGYRNNTSASVALAVITVIKMIMCLLCLF